MNAWRTTLFTACLAAMAAAAGAEQPNEKSVELNIQAQPVGDALNAFAAQTGLQVVLFADVSQGIASPRISGSYAPEAALKLLLMNTGLRYEYINERTIAIRGKSPAISESSNSLSPEEAAFQVAQASNSSSSAASGEDRPLTAAEQPADPAAKGIPEILVKGARVLNTDIKRTRDDAQPYLVFGRQSIERSSASNLEEFLRQRLPSEASFSANNQNVGFVGNTSSINLRGLGTDETLILIDGRRLAGFGIAGIPGQPDINGIPLAAVERIEVLPTTASGIYGGGATGGVVNIVMRRDYSATELKLTYGNSFDGAPASRRIDLSSGINLEGGRTNILFAGSYAEADKLLMSDRDLVERGRAWILAHNPAGIFGTTPLTGATTNIRGSGGASLTLKNSNIPLNSSVTYIPAGYAGVSSDNGAALVANAGQFNLALADTAQSGGGQQTLLNTPLNKSAMVTVRRDFTDWLTPFMALAVSHSSARSDSVNSTGNFSLPVTSPINPFNQSIVVSTPMFGANSLTETRMENQRATGGVIVKLPHQWSATADYTWNRVRFTATGGAFDNTTAAADVRTGQRNIMRDTRAFPVDFSSYLLEPIVNGPADTTLRDAALRLSGPLGWELPGGAPTISTLLERRTETMGDFIQTQESAPGVFVSVLAAERSQTVDSAYVEATLPLIGARNALRGAQMLELQLAGRWDDYESEGANGDAFIVDGEPVGVMRQTNRVHSIDPTLGLRYQPVSQVMMRASYGTGFLPPALDQLISATFSSPIDAFTTTFLQLRDPVRGNELLGDFVFSSGGAPQLKSEESESFSAGVVFTPDRIPGLRLSLDWTQIEKSDAIIAPNPFEPDELSAVILFAPEHITRAAAAPGDPYGVGPITAVDGSLTNFASARVEAYDMALDYQWQTARLGTFTFASNSTYLVKNAQQIAPTAAYIESAGVLGNAKFKGNATLTWDYKSWTVAWTARYFAPYYLNTQKTFSPNQGSNFVGSQNYHDLFAGYRFDSPRWQGTELQLGIGNVFNTKPPVDVSSANRFYSRFGDPRLGYYFVGLRRSF